VDNSDTIVSHGAHAPFLSPNPYREMTEEQLSPIWNAAVNEAKDLFSPAVRKSIFGQSHLKAINGPVAEITVDNQQSGNFILKYGQEALLRSLTQAMGTPITQISYKVVKPKETSKPVTENAVSVDEQLFRQPSNSARPNLEPNATLASGLNPKYTFASFIVGNRNRLAHAAALGVVDDPGTLYNPLYLYGGVGLGKTHLMQAIGNAMLKRNPECRVMYVSAETFMNEFVQNIRKGGRDDFKKKYRNVDLFLVDDIQFMAGKDGMQEEFFHTFNALYQGNAQIVITSDQVPAEIKGLEDRLASRFSQGMIADMQLPDMETRQAILISKAQERGIKLPLEGITYIADQIDTNIRELEGALTRVILDLHANGHTQPTLAEVKKALNGTAGANKPSKKSSAATLSEIICGFYGIEFADLIGPRRQQELVRPRQIFMYLLKHELGMTFPMIGREVGGRDHTTAMHSVEKIEKEMKKSPELLDELQQLKEQFYSHKN
jgi:chromosomal replication initiator protein